MIYKQGQRVVLEKDGRIGTLQNARGCHCGPNAEACWDIALDDGGGIQAHGGTFFVCSYYEKSLQAIKLVEGWMEQDSVNCEQCGGGPCKGTDKGRLTTNGNNTA